MSILNSIKSDIKKAGSSKSKILYIKGDSKARVRFLTDLENAIEVKLHKNFQEGIDMLCRESYGQHCEMCEQEIKAQSMYVFCVWDVENKEVKLFEGFGHKFNHLPNMVTMFETYGNITDRDYVLVKTGDQLSATFSVAPMDKARFKNAKAKPLTKKEIIKILNEAHGKDGSDEEEEEESPKKKGPKKQSPKKKRKPEPEYEEDEEDDFEDDDDFEDYEEETPDYDSMKPIELYRLCKERGIEDVKPKKKAAYYVELLEEWDEENAEDDDEWDEDEEDFDEEEDDEDLDW